MPGQSVMCPILLKLIRNPVLNICDGKVYERWALEEWANENNTCPTTRKPLLFIGLERIAQTLELQQLQLKEAYHQFSNLSANLERIQYLHQKEVDMLENIIKNQTQMNKLWSKTL